MTGFVPAPVKPQVAMDDLDKIDIRVGTIERVEAVPRSNKLVKLTVDFGDQRRSVLAGLRQERGDPKAELQGRQGLFVVNLAPRKMAGEISQAMLFDIGYADGVVPVLAMGPLLLFSFPANPASPASPPRLGGPLSRVSSAGCGRRLSPYGNRR